MKSHCLILLTGLVLATRVPAAPLTVDFRALVTRGDLNYAQPAARSEEGMPVGNGRMGSLVWTTPFALKFQINRVDVFGEDSTTVSFPQADSDYAAGCAYLDVNLVQAGDDVFVGKDFHQHLSLYDAVMTARGKGVTARVLAWPRRDVMAVEIEDRRPRPEPINVDLRMLRYAMQRVTGRNYQLATNHAVLVRTAEQTALSKLDIRNGRILLIQQFRENAFYDSSAVAVSVIGRESKARYLNESTVELSVVPGNGQFTVLISSAASFDPEADVGTSAVAELEAAEPKGFTGLEAETADWWHHFWSKGYVYLHSASGQADFVEANYTYFLYLMGASSRGEYHILHVNNSESDWGTSDTPYELSSMHLIFPLAIRASEILGVDAELRPLWREIEDNLPMPPQRNGSARGRAYGAFVYGGQGAMQPIGPEPELKQRFLGFDRLGSFIDTAGTGGAQIFRNRLRLREGPGAIDAEHLGGLVSGIHSTLLSSDPEAPDSEPVLRLFDRWPKDWDAAFTLRAQGAFVVSSAQLNGKIPFVSIRSEAGSDCVLRNPWTGVPVTLYRHGRKAENLSAELIRFSTTKGEEILVLPRGADPSISMLSIPR